MLRLLAIALVVCVLLKCMGGLGGGGNRRFVRLDTSQYDSFMDGWEATGNSRFVRLDTSQYDSFMDGWEAT
jgi:hypothetical protein